MTTQDIAWLPDGSDGTGVLQHLIARVQLNKAGLPATTLQAGVTDLDRYAVEPGQELFQDFFLD